MMESQKPKRDEMDLVITNPVVLMQYQTKIGILAEKKKPRG